MEITLTKDNFEDTLLKATKPVLVDFWATWCGPCRMLAPILEEIAAERGDVIIGKVNVDEEVEIANAFKIESIPTLILFKDGKAVRAGVGYMPKDKVISMITD